MVVEVYDDKGLNFTMKSRNAIGIVTSLLHSIKANYVVIDWTHSNPEDKDEVDYTVIIDN